MSLISKALSGVTRSGGILRRNSISLSYLAGGFASSKILSHIAEERRNYYGDSEYQRRYKGGLETASALAPYAGAAMGIGRIFKMDPLGIGERVANTGMKMLLKPVSGARNIIEKMRLGTAPTSTPFTRLVSAVNSRPGIGPVVARGAIAGIGIGTAGLITNYPAQAAGGLIGLGSLAAIATAYRVGGLSTVGGLVGASAAGLGAAYYNSERVVYPAAEGRITDARQNMQSTTSKMNFSTAGLVQALHQNRRG